jgi:WD40 repeat protein
VHSLQSQYYLFTISTDGKILIWKYNSEYPEKSLAFPSKGHMLVSRKSNNDKVTILHGATALEGLSGASSLTDRNYLIGLHNGLVQRCTIKLPEAKDIRHFLQPRKDITWSDAAIHFMCNCYHQRNSQKIVDLVDNYMIDKKAYPRNV